MNVPAKTDDVMQAFAERVEEEVSVMPPAQLPAVHIRPVGAQAITIRRDPEKVLRDLRVFARAAGDNWYYRWNVNDKNSKTGKSVVEGPSVKLANDLARLYGNCTAEIQRVDDIGTHWVFHARFVDFETGYEYGRPFQQRKAQGKGQGMQADRALDIAFQIGASKAMRNAIVNALGTFADYAITEAKEALTGRIEKNPAHYLEKITARLGELQVDLKRVERAVGRAFVDWKVPDMARVIAELQAIGEGMATPDELWPTGEAIEAKPDKVAAFAESEAVLTAAADKVAAGQTATQILQEAGTEKKEPAELPQFLPAKGTAADTMNFFDATNPEHVRAKFPNNPPDWVDGYVARADGLVDEAPQSLPHGRRTTWSLGWRTRDKEEKANGKDDKQTAPKAGAKT